MKKYKNDCILGFSGLVILPVECSSCGATQTDNPGLSFWQKQDGEILCSSCNCTLLLDDNDRLRDESTRRLKEYVDNAARTMLAYQEKITELTNRIAELEGNNEAN